MRQTKICQQPDCKKFLISQNEKESKIRCKDCHNKIFQQSITQISEKKNQLLIRKKQLQEEFEQYFKQNKQKWDEGVEQILKALRVKQLQEKKQALINNVNVRKRNLASYQEELENHIQLNGQLKQLSQSIQEKYYNLKKTLKQKQKDIQKLEMQLKQRQYIIFTQLPFLFDNHMIYKYYQINDEIQETFYDTINELSYSQHEDVLLFSTSFFNLDLAQQNQCTKINSKKVEICLTLKKSIVKWNDILRDNLQYYENFITSIIKVYKLIYFIANLFHIVLPYVIYIDNHGYPQFFEYEIFSYNRISNQVNFKECSLTQMQINIFYLKYYFNIDIQDKLYSFFDIIDLLQSIYDKLEFHQFDQFKNLTQVYISQIKNSDNQQVNKIQQKRKPIPIKLVQAQYLKFLLQHQISEQQINNRMDNFYDFSDVEFIQ